MAIIGLIYGLWFLAAIGLYVSGAPASTMGAMIGGPIGWTIGIALLLGIEWMRSRRP